MVGGVLLLAVRLRRGYGVSVVAEETARELQSQGVPAAIGCCELGRGFDGLDVRVVPAESAAVAATAQALGCRAIVALTTPYFELLPELGGRFPCWAWEWGDPTPAFFPAERAARQAIVDRKRRFVYPALRGVLAGSAFLRMDIGWPAARVLYPGADHAPDRGEKPGGDRRDRGAGRLRVGTLMRLGPGEAHYKGGELFREIKDRADREGLRCSFAVLGRGADADARALRESGIEVELNAPEERKWDYLRGLDVFVSCSLWEGFNLPLAEAQALGTPGLAFDVGAHPEVTPLVMGGVDDVVTQLRAYAARPGLLETHAAAARRFVRGRFRWRDTARSLWAEVGGDG